MLLLDGRMQPVLNRAANPGVEVNLLGWQSNNGAQMVVSRSTDTPINGLNSALSTRTATSPSPFASSLYLVGSGTVGVQSFLVTPGDVLTWRVSIRPELPSRRVSPAYVAYRNDAGAVTNGKNLVSAELRTDSATTIVITEAVPAGVTSAIFSVAVSTFSGNAQTNERVWYDSLSIIKSNPQADYFDGGRPGAKWLGAAGASQSVGYPRLAP